MFTYTHDQIEMAKVWAPVVGNLITASGVIFAARVAVKLAGERSRMEHTVRIELERGEHERNTEMALLDEMSKKLHAGYATSSLEAARRRLTIKPNADAQVWAMATLQAAQDWPVGVRGLLSRFDGYMRDPVLLAATKEAVERTIDLNKHSARDASTLADGESLLVLAKAKTAIAAFDAAVTTYLRTVRHKPV